jgi:peptidoglycan/xylan/chitin deacetylase (PgdA/CDA1 family)
LERGAFTLSLDFELIWGTLENYGPDAYRSACETERAEVVDRLLALLAEFEVSATWCTLGHLFLDGCAPQNGVKHPEIVAPRRANGEDWFAYDPGTDERRDPIYYGRTLVRKVQDCPVPQEIGGHSFSHVLFARCSAETAASDLAELVRAANEVGVEPRSFAFPGNEVGHLELLPRHGFTCYRGPEPSWYGGPGAGALRRFAHLFDILSARRPPVSESVEELPGLWNVPASMMYFPMHGRRRHIPLSRRVRRAVKGLDRAAAERRVFHLWFHPTNLADEIDQMFAGLRSIFEHASALRSDGTLEVASMGALADKAAAALAERR